MLTIRLAKILMIAAVGAFAFMVTYDNIVDYGSNYEFVRHVLSMDTTFSGNALMDRAVTDAPAEDERFMRMALDEARQADFPFGAVIVREGQVIARGRNLGRTNDDPTAHGEMVAIRRCLADHGSAALMGSTLYTSGEPCVMCMGAIVWCRFGRLVFAASIERIAARINQIMISSADVAAKESFLPIKITGGVLADEAVQLLGK
jgi:tRNA(adenine34) deaminase